MDSDDIILYGIGFIFISAIVIVGLYLGGYIFQSSSPSDSPTDDGSPYSDPPDNGPPYSSVHSGSPNSDKIAGTYGYICKNDSDCISKNCIGKKWYVVGKNNKSSFDDATRCLYKKTKTGGDCLFFQNGDLKGCIEEEKCINKIVSNTGGFYKNICIETVDMLTGDSSGWFTNPKCVNDHTLAECQWPPEQPVKKYYTDCPPSSGKKNYGEKCVMGSDCCDYSSNPNVKDGNCDIKNRFGGWYDDTTGTFVTGGVNDFVCYYDGNYSSCIKFQKINTTTNSGCIKKEDCKTLIGDKSYSPYGLVCIETMNGTKGNSVLK